MRRVSEDVDDKLNNQLGELVMKIIKKVLLAAMLVLPVSTFADGNVIGTGAYHTLSSVPNIYYQHKLSDSSAVVLGYGSVDGFDLGGSFGTLTATAVGISYKGTLATT